jgi:hypothetical protein
VVSSSFWRYRVLELRTKIVKRDFGLIAKAKMLIGGNNPPCKLIAPPHRMPHRIPHMWNVKQLIFKLNKQVLYNQYLEAANNHKLSTFKLTLTLLITLLLTVQYRRH